MTTVRILLLGVLLVAAVPGPAEAGPVHAHAPAAWTVSPWTEVGDGATVPRVPVPVWIPAVHVPWTPPVRVQPHPPCCELPLGPDREYLLLPLASRPAGTPRAVYVRYWARDPSLA